jgi:hypothetical protein
MFSVGLSSGDLDGKSTIEMLAGSTSLSELCQPA